MSDTTHHEKVRLTVECSLDERMYIKMLAAKKHMTISELLLSPIKKLIPFTRQKHRSHEPNADTCEALKESRESKLESYKTLDDFWKAMKIDPDA